MQSASEKQRQRHRLCHPSRKSSPSAPSGTGGPKALQEILPRFPGDLATPLLIVQHMPEGFQCIIRTALEWTLFHHGRCEACSHGDIIRPGTAYIAPSGSQMRVVPSDLQPMISIDHSPHADQHAPSIDVLMKSVALLYKSRAMGVIMTGMGSDGAEGMKAIHRAGGFTIGQDEATCAVYGMPRVCAEMGILDRVVPLSEIPAQVMRATLRRRQARIMV